MNKELMTALDVLEKEKNIDRNALLDAIENSLITACKNGNSKTDNVRVELDRETCDFHVYAEKTVTEAEDILDKSTEISPEDAVKTVPDAKIGDKIEVELDAKNFGRIATQNAKNVIIQRIRDEERNAVYKELYAKETGIVAWTGERCSGRRVAGSVGRAVGLL